MLRIRLFRVGKKNQPFFKIVVTDKRKPPRAGRFVEQVGFYNPLSKEKNLKAERIRYWLSIGAKPSATVHNLLISENIIEGKKIGVHKKPKKQEKPFPAPADSASVDNVASMEGVTTTKPEGKSADTKAS
ncbi:MAG: 30S ribosomal protein S16 [Candidatus Nealsonbacteria bacterium]|nr:30S ribosomal protein S16 [Candidatus Nealsonbacteria bacterium]